MARCLHLHCAIHHISTRWPQLVTQQRNTSVTKLFNKIRINWTEQTELNVSFVRCHWHRFVVNTRLRWGNFSADTDESIIEMANASLQPDYATADPSLHGILRVWTYSWLDLPLLLVGFSSEDLGQRGNSIEVTAVTWGRTRHRGKGFGKDGHLPKREKGHHALLRAPKICF